jgi:predicted N-acyltransferase
MPRYLHLIFAIQDGQRVASSMIFRNRAQHQERAYGRYWGATRFIKNLHFETAYYQNIEFCIGQKISVFEGGAQGEHKIHRGLIPVNLYSMHYLLDERFYDAVNQFLKREGMSMYRYIDELSEHHPIKQTAN